ncbi:unnamed protein product [Calicophoron daubneyi]|uniref:G-protein coupled receptors family 1 profile domain-containing protein n=1 Tax=Calicophoron daubneyi TaxID=300641 RepID=A0AAV2T5L6_CALDB
MKNCTCFAYINSYEILRRSVAFSSKETFIQFAASIAAVLVYPVSVIGVLGNLLLFCILIKKVRRSRRLEVWGCVLAVNDMLYITTVGILRTDRAYGTPWWGSVEIPFETVNHWSCKYFVGWCLFLSTFRANVLFFLLLACTEKCWKLRPKKSTDILIACLMFIAFFLTLLQITPVVGVYGLSQDKGLFRCDIDSQWAKEYTDFVYVHRILYTGTLQAFCNILLSVLVWRRLTSTQKMISFLEQNPPSRDMVNCLLLAIRFELNDTGNDVSIILIMALTNCVCRFVSSIAELVVHLMRSNISEQSSASLRVELMTLESVRPLIWFLDVLLSGINYVWWYIFLPELHDWLSSIKERLICRRGIRLLPASKEYKAKTYFERSAQTLGIFHQLTTRYVYILDQLHRLRDHLTVQYVQEGRYVKQNQYSGDTQPIRLQPST